VDIVYPADTGEVNTASNLGLSGVGVYDSKSGVNLRFRSVAVTSPYMSVALGLSGTIDLGFSAGAFVLGSTYNSFVSAIGNTVSAIGGTVTYLGSSYLTANGLSITALGNTNNAMGVTVNTLGSSYLTAAGNSIIAVGSTATAIGTTVNYLGSSYITANGNSMTATGTSTLAVGASVRTAGASLLVLGSTFTAFQTASGNSVAGVGASLIASYTIGAGISTYGGATQVGQFVVDSRGRIAGASIVNIAYPAAGSGDVVGPASSFDNALARYDSTTGKLIQNSMTTISDAGWMATGSGVSVAEKPLHLGSSAAGGIALFERFVGATTGNFAVTQIRASSSTGIADGYAVTQTYEFKVGTSVYIVADFAAFRDGADNSGKFVVAAYSGGSRVPAMEFYKDSTSRPAGSIVSKTVDLVYGATLNIDGALGNQFNLFLT